MTYFIRSSVVDQNFFVNPPVFVGGHDFSHNDVWALGSWQLVQWSADLPSYNILLWQQNRTGAGNICGLSRSMSNVQGDITNVFT